MRMSTITLPDGREEVLEAFEVHGVKVPAGFIFDGASTPRLFWSIIPPYKDVKIAACVHDHLCEVAQCKEDRLFADRLFYKMLIENPRINDTRALIGYVGVRIGAWLGIGVRYPHWTGPIKDLIRKAKRQVV